MNGRKWKLAAGVVAVLAVLGGGVAVAANQFDDPKAESEAVIADAAEQLGVPPSRLTDALKKALQNRVDAAVAAGRITEAQGEKLKSAIEAGDLPLFGVGPALEKGHFEFGANLDAAADYLGLTNEELKNQLESGKTLAEIAKDRGKSVDGLVDALVVNAKQKLDGLVEAGKLTRAEADKMLADLRECTEDLVNGTAPRFRHGPRSFFHNGPPAAPAALGPFA